METAAAVTMVASPEHGEMHRVTPGPVRATQLALDLPQRYVGFVPCHKSTHPVTIAKQLGAYYTDDGVAAFLVRWALRPGSDVHTVLDPSCGDGVFLRAACRAFACSGSKRTRRVLGVDIDPSAAAAAQTRLSREFGPTCCELVVGNFFDQPAVTYRVGAVVGNPPFVRFHRFAGDQRAKALARSAEQGVSLSGLSSSWAPFVVHSVGTLQAGGQLAMVLPSEVTYAVYARPVMEYLLHAFAEVSVITFRNPLFPDLNEDTVLLLAREKGGGPGTLACLDLEDASALESLRWDARGSLCGARAFDAERLSRGEHRMALHFLPLQTSTLWSQVSADGRLSRLGEIADLGIGYVTGANDFFHLSPEEASAWSIPSQFLADAVVRSRALTGLAFTETDWTVGLSRGSASYLLHINGARELPPGLLAYVRHGEATGIPHGYKCRNRQPWYSVPQVVPPDAFLTYMSHEMPRVVANVCGAVAPNTLHCVNLKKGTSLDGLRLALLWCNSLSRLSAEVEGHALGGGMLKLEPGEARRVVLPPLPQSWESPEFRRVFADCDALLRAGRQDELLDRVDQIVLGDGLGLAPDEWRMLREGARQLRQRRLHRAA